MGGLFRALAKSDERAQNFGGTVINFLVPRNANRKEKSTAIQNADSGLLRTADSNLRKVFLFHRSWDIGKLPILDHANVGNTIFVIKW